MVVDSACPSLPQTVLSVANIWLIGGKLLAELIEYNIGTQTVSGSLRARTRHGVLRLVTYFREFVKPATGR